MFDVAAIVSISPAPPPALWGKSSERRTRLPLDMAPNGTVAARLADSIPGMPRSRSFSLRYRSWLRGSS